MTFPVARAGASVLAALALSPWCLAGCGGPAKGAPMGSDAPVAGSGVEPHGKPSSPPTPALVVADSTAAPAAPAAEPEVAVDLAVGKRQELATQAHKDLDVAVRLLASLGAPADPVRSERIRTAQSLVEQANKVLPDDPDAAATLARKARLLAEEITASH